MVMAVVVAAVIGEGVEAPERSASWVNVPPDEATVSPLNIACWLTATADRHDPSDAGSIELVGP